MFSLLIVVNIEKSIASMKRVANIDNKGSPGQGLLMPQNFHSLCAPQLEHPARNSMSEFGDMWMFGNSCFGNERSAWYPINEMKADEA